MEVKRTNTRYKGLSLVEAALVFPILLLLTFGLIHYGWLFLSAHKITSAARHGARLAIRHVSNPPSDPCEVNVEGVIIEMLENEYGITGASVDITGGYASAPMGAEITATVTVDATPATGAALLIVPLLPNPDTLSASVTMVKEGP